MSNIQVYQNVQVKYVHGTQSKLCPSFCECDGRRLSVWVFATSNVPVLLQGCISVEPNRHQPYRNCVTAISDTSQAIWWSINNFYVTSVAKHHENTPVSVT
jgi:hypothetical protein